MNKKSNVGERQKIIFKGWKAKLLQLIGRVEGRKCEVPAEIRSAVKNIVINMNGVR